MKKNYTILFSAFLMLFALQSSAQVPRMALVEEATQASCGPCASANPTIQALINDNDNAIMIAYQVWWPGFDQMYLDNSDEIDVRVGDYYGYGFAPQVVLQGDFVGTDGGAAELTQAEIDDVTATDSEFMIELQAVVENGVLHVTGMVEADMAAEGDFKLRMMLAEDLITAEEAPGGTNGETEYHHVFKKFIPGTDGIDLENTWEAGDMYEIDEMLDLSTLTIYGYDRLEVFAMVQNDDNKYVHQAAKISDIEIIVDFDNTASAAQISPIDAVCAGTNTVSPVVKVANTGNNELTSATITYDVNGGTSQTFEWTGSLSTLGNENVTLDPITFETSDVNMLNVVISNPNGMDDEFADDDSATYEIAEAGSTATYLVVNILTDNYGDELYWEIQNSAGAMVASGGNPNVGLTNVGTGTFPPPASTDSYGNAQTYTIGVDVPAIDCYTFYMADYYGDGFLGTGYITVEDNNGNELFNSEGFADLTENNYQGTEIGVGVEEQELISDFAILSNPIVNDLNIRFNLANASATNITVLDAQGRTILAQSYGQLSQGTHVETLDMGAVANGIYFVNLTSGDQVRTEKIVVTK